MFAPEKEKGGEPEALNFRIAASSPLTAEHQVVSA
jgi:hypothetical protein